MVWTFYLEENARFSDGTKVTADDVIASYEAARKSDYYKGRFSYYISEIKAASDGNGVTFMLNAPFENLALLLDVPIVKASEVEAEHPLGAPAPTPSPETRPEPVWFGCAAGGRTQISPSGPM